MDELWMSRGKMSVMLHYFFALMYLFTTIQFRRQTFMLYAFMAENETITQSTYKYANRRLQASRPPKSSTLTIVREALTTLI